MRPQPVERAKGVPLDGEKLADVLQRLLTKTIASATKVAERPEHLKS